MDKTLPKYLLGKYQLIGTVTFSVLFALVYLNIAIPFSETAWFGLGDSVMFLFTLVFVGIAILTLIVSRMLMYQANKKHLEFTFLIYAVWCIIEILFISGLYTWITINVVSAERTIWETLRTSLINGFTALGIPYVLSGMYFAIIDKNNTIKLMNYENVVTDEAPKPETSFKKITLFGK